MNMMLHKRSSTFGAINVVESPLAVKYEPVRQHSPGIHRASYHARIQKKWTKRFGMKSVPTVLFINNAAASMNSGLGGLVSTVVCHPDLYDRIVELLGREKANAPS